MTGFFNPLGRLAPPRTSVRQCALSRSVLLLPCSTASTNALITDRVDIGSPVSIINGEKTSTPTDSLTELPNIIQ